MGLFDKVFEDQTKFIEKIGIEDTSSKTARRAGLGGNDWLNAITGGSLSKSTMLGAVNLAKNPSFRNAKTALQSAQRQNVTSAYAMNLGHQAANMGRMNDEGGRPPAVGPGPAMGAGVSEAERNARARAIQQARGRFGFRQTINTTPLGIQGDGASTAKRRLIGE